MNADHNLAVENVTITGTAAEELKLRDNGENMSPQYAMDRYFTALCDARLKLVRKFSLNEIHLILDRFNGSIFNSPSTIEAIAFEVHEAIRLDGLDKKWKVNGKRLIRKLESLDYISRVALVDAVERWWMPLREGKVQDKNIWDLFIAPTPFSVIAKPHQINIEKP
jgi:hypothetical protein